MRLDPKSRIGGTIRTGLLLFFAFNITVNAFAQPTAIDHWETIVYDSSIWKYFPGTSDPGQDWNKFTFADGAWSEGRGGFGYADNDDRTVIGPVISVFMRKKFNVIDLGVIEKAVLHVDFDDGFIAYINGVEVARVNMGFGFPAYNQGSVGLHEALMYQGGRPEAFTISKTLLSNLLVEGENTLAIEVHNESLASSDLSAAAFLSVGVSDNSFNYGVAPDWFTSTEVTSNLPLIIINTDGRGIPDEPAIIADMGIIDNGSGLTNSTSDEFNNYSGKIEIEVRGESSQMFPKKSFRVETKDESGNNRNASLLGMPPDNDWVLYAPYTDKTFMRDVLTYKLGNDLGSYAPRTRFVELIINGDYQGVYVLIEKIKRDKNRVDIATLKPEDVSGDDVTGGYILRVDKIDGNDFPAWQSVPVPSLPGEAAIEFQYHDPKGEDLVSVQRSYIRDYIFDFGSALTAGRFTGSKSYKTYIDIPSFINFMLVNEIGKNVDGYKFSTYLYKEKDSKGGKLFMGPLWDFNLCYGNVDYWDNSQFAPGWIWNDPQRMFWFRRMIQDPAFASALKCRWTELRQSFLTNDYFINAIDSMASVVEGAQQRNYDRWRILGTYVWPNQFIGQTYQDEINFMKQWIVTRLEWMDANMPGNCNGVVTGVEEELKGIEVYPNPSNTSFYVRIPEPLSANLIEVNILSITGQTIYHSSTLEEGLLWNGLTQDAPVAPGIYIAEIKTNRGVKRQRIVKE